MAGKIIVESVTDALAVGSNIIEAAKSEIAWLLPPEMLIFSSQFGLTDKCEALVANGGRVRGITRVTNTYAKVIGKILDIGEEIRHVDRYQGAFMAIERTFLWSDRQGADGWCRSVAFDIRI